MCPTIDSGHIAANQKDSAPTLWHVEKKIGYRLMDQKGKRKDLL